MASKRIDHNAKPYILIWGDRWYYAFTVDRPDGYDQPTYNVIHRAPGVHDVYVATKEGARKKVAGTRIEGVEWLSIKTSEIERETVQRFMAHLKKFNVTYATFSTGSWKQSRMYMRLSLPYDVVNDPNHEYHSMMGEYVMYYPITLLSQKPKNISDFDYIEDLSTEDA